MSATISAICWTWIRPFLLLHNFYDYLFLGIGENLACLYEDPKNIHIIFRQHKGILASIKARDKDKAYAAMKEHINFVVEFFKNRKKEALPPNKFHQDAISGEFWRQ